MGETVIEGSRRQGNARLVPLFGFALTMAACSQSTPAPAAGQWAPKAAVSAESLGSEAVLSALMLAWDDARTGHLSADNLTAFDHMWAQQHTSGDSAGAWSWLDFDLSPWESAAVDAQYYGAALAAMAAGVAPENYQSRPQIQNSLRLLRDYLAREYPAQSLHHRLI